MSVYTYSGIKLLFKNLCYQKQQQNPLIFVTVLTDVEFKNIVCFK